MEPEGRAKSHLGELTGKESLHYKKAALNMKACGPEQVRKPTPGSFVIKILWPGQQPCLGLGSEGVEGQEVGCREGNGLPDVRGLAPESKSPDFLLQSFKFMGHQTRP